MFEVEYLMAICVFEYASFGKFSLAPGRIRAYKQHCALKFSGQSTPPSPTYTQGSGREPACAWPL